MIEVWRIVREAFAADAFSGEGARLYGGRWNLPGSRMIYTASSRSLAILEILVHIRQSRPLAGFVLIPVRFQSELVQQVEQMGLPELWDREPPAPASQTFGSAWLKGAEKPVLSVPSVVVPEERNFLLNPQHSFFAQIEIGEPLPCRIDRRLVG